MITCTLLLHVTIPVHNYITTLSYNRLTTQTPNDHYKYNIMCEKFIYRSCVELRLQRGRGGGGEGRGRGVDGKGAIVAL